MSPLAWAGFVAAGAIGAPLRYLVDDAIRRRTKGPFPWGTLVINVSGSALLGFLVGLALYHSFPATPRLILGTGFCGAYTTFSTFSYETVRLLGDGELGAAWGNLAITAFTCAAAAAVGLAFAAL